MILRLLILWVVIAMPSAIVTGRYLAARSKV
jgi:hypothetical protein